MGAKSTPICTMQNFTSFFFREAVSLSIGYLAGLSASILVSRFFVRKGLVNLWGLTSKKQALSKDDYEWAMAIAAYLIGLAVMVVVNYFVKRMKGEIAED
jgi:hypothetical protein